MSEPTQPYGSQPGIPGSGQPPRPIPPGYYAGPGYPANQGQPGYHSGPPGYANHPGYAAQPGYQPQPGQPGYHPGYGQPGYGHPGYPYAGHPQPPLTAPPRPKEVTRAGWLMIISAVLQIAVFALMIAYFSGSTSAHVALVALAGTGMYLVVAVALNFFLRAGFRFARITVAGVGGISLLGTADSFSFGPAAAVVSLLAAAAWAGAAVLLFQRSSNEFFRGSWAARRVRWLNRF